MVERLVDVWDGVDEKRVRRIIYTFYGPLLGGHAVFTVVKSFVVMRDSGSDVLGCLYGLRNIYREPGGPDCGDPKFERCLDKIIGLYEPVPEVDLSRVTFGSV